MTYNNYDIESIFEGSILKPIELSSITKDILKDSLIHFESYVAEFNLSLKNGCDLERTIFSMLTLAGFTLNNTGTKYLYWLLVTNVNNYAIPKKMKDCYESAADFFEKPAKSIEISIKRSIESANTKKLSKLNELLEEDIVNVDKPIKVGEFLTDLIAKLVMLRSHQNGKPFFSTHNYND